MDSPSEQPIPLSELLLKELAKITQRLDNLEKKSPTPRFTSAPLPGKSNLCETLQDKTQEQYDTAVISTVRDLRRQLEEARNGRTVAVDQAWADARKVYIEEAEKAKAVYLKDCEHLQQTISRLETQINELFKGIVAACGESYEGDQWWEASQEEILELIPKALAESDKRVAWWKDKAEKIKMIMPARCCTVFGVGETWSAQQISDAAKNSGIQVSFEY